MTDVARKPLRIWLGVVIVTLQFIALYGSSTFAPGTPIMFFGMMGSFLVGGLLIIVWWLFLSRASWLDRLSGFALLVGAWAVAFILAHPSSKMVMMVPGVPWLCAAFVLSLFAGKRVVTVAAVLLATFGWTLVRTDGVTGAMDADYAWRFGSTAEDRFMASEASAVPSSPTASDEVAGASSSPWPGFRGPARDGVLHGVTIDPDWSQNPPQEVWRRPVGPGWGSFVLVDNRLCTQEQRDENEVVVCYDAKSGEPIWLHAYPARFWEAMAGVGPRSTPTYHDGRLYALGATGVLSCLDAATGRSVWSRDIVDDSNGSVPDWGFASSPLIVDDLVIVHAPGAQSGRAVVAYELDSGEPRWFGQAEGHSYSSPHLVTIDGVRQVVMVTGEAIFGVALDESPGELLWRHEWSMGANGSRVLQPALVDGGAGMLIGTSFGMGTRRLAVSSDGAGGWAVDEVWTSRGLKPYYNDLVVHRGTAFGFDGNILSAIDVTSGERAWKGGRYGNGQMLLLPDQDLLLVLSEKGELALVRASAEGFEELARIDALTGKTWNHPIVVDGMIYLRNGEEAAAFRLPV